MASARHQAREAALQALYLWEVGGAAPSEALATYFSEHRPDAPETVRQFASALVLGTTADVAALDALVARHSSRWRIERLAIVDRLILRMASWELQHEPDTPAAVVMNEALELARTFGSDDSVRFVNAATGQAGRPRAPRRAAVSERLRSDHDGGRRQGWLRREVGPGTRGHAG
jgi:N utilization substance protein B